jgi:surface protein
VKAVSQSVSLLVLTKSKFYELIENGDLNPQVLDGMKQVDRARQAENEEKMSVLVMDDSGNQVVRDETTTKCNPGSNTELEETVISRASAGRSSSISSAHSMQMSGMMVLTVVGLGLSLLSGVVEAAFDQLPNGNAGTDASERVGSLGGVVDEWIAGGTKRATVVEKYGEIEDWDLSEVTNAMTVFYCFGDQKNKASFNADISKWITAAVTDMGYSTSTPPSCFCCCFFHLNSVHSLPLLYFFTFSRFYFWILSTTAPTSSYSVR